MLFSIIVPVYNVEKYIDECVQSIIEQTYKEYEVILVDDGSTDKSGSLCDQISSRDKRFLVIHQKNRGLSGARNTGIKVASGDYILFVDSDDYWDDTNALSKIAKTIDSTKSDLIIWGYKKLNDSTKMLTEEDNYYSRDSSSIITSVSEIVQKGIYNTSSCTKAIKKHIVLDNDLAFVEGDTSEDIEWSANLLKKVESIVAIPANFYIYRQRTGSITKTKTRKNIDILIRQIGNISSNANGDFINNQMKELYSSFVAEQFANVIIVVASNSNAKQDIQFIEKNKKILSKGRTRRCKYFTLFLGVIPVKVLLKVIKIIRK